MAVSFLNIYMGVAVSVCLLFSLGRLVTPDSDAFLLSEDGSLEDITALVFLASFLKGMYCLKMRGEPQTLPFALVPLLGIVGFLDEISFGTRLFLIPVPVISGVGLDGIHDLALIGGVILKRNENLIIYGVILVLGAVPFNWLPARCWSSLPAIVGKIRLYPPFALVASFVVLNIISTVLDVHLPILDLCRSTCR